MKKYIWWAVLVLFVIGSIATGGPFNLIDMIVVRPIVNILFVIFNLVHDFGLAIIIFTILVKLLMIPLTKRQLNQTKLIRKIQPELTKIKENCRGNKQLESIQTMDLYRRYNVKPFASIVTLIVQLPIFVAIFSAINVIAVPRVNDNLSNRAYPIVAYQGSEIQTLMEKQQVYLTDQQNEEIPAEEKAVYDFHPQLFGVINLDVKPSDILMGRFSWSALFLLGCAILSALLQFWVTRQQMPSGKANKNKKFREMVREAKAGRELDESDISALTTSQMSFMMPLMMFFVMFNLNGALVFYYFLSNILTLIQQKIVLRKVNEEIDEVTDKAVLKELRHIKEAEVIENKKTGTKITRISAKDTKSPKNKTTKTKTTNKKKRR